MPEFAPGETRTAIAPITVAPTGLSCSAEVFLGPDELTKVSTSGNIGFTSTGAEQSISLPITMPSEEGAYHVYVDVYAEGYLIAAYQAIEDVVIGPAVGDFAYSNPQLTHYPLPEAPVWHWVDYSVTITNQAAAQGARTITFIYERWSTYDGSLEQRVERTLDLTLAPSESYTWTIQKFDAVGGQIHCVAHVEDNYGDRGGDADFYR